MAPPPFDIAELTISSFHGALRQQRTTCTSVVRAYQDRILQYDATLKALISINPDALITAAQKDEETTKLLASTTPFPPLHGVPIILKDNYGTRDLPTSAGVRALQTLRANTDSAVVSLLRDAGAIILAKANLHEFALQGTTTSSLGGQTLNPYDLTRTPGGSSGGTAAALAANLGLLGCGTDTMNSLRSPASACAIVGFRPSRGRVSCEGIVPVSETQDAAGPMGRTVEDVKVLFEVMRDETMEHRLATIQGRKVRIGVLDAYFALEEQHTHPNPHEDLIAENSMIQNTIHNALSTVQDQEDITLIHIAPTSHADWSINTLLSSADTQAFEFQTSLNNYLQSHQISSTAHFTLESIIASGDYDSEAVTHVFTAGPTDPATYSPHSEAYSTRLRNIAILKKSVQRCFDAHDLDALAYPHQRHLVVKVGMKTQCCRNGILGALTGRPAICIPGKST